MKKIGIVLCIGVLIACEQVPKSKVDISGCNVVWESQSENSRGSMPIGNGDVGANVWVSPAGELLFLISKTDAWNENGTLLKVGRLKVVFSPNILAEKSFKQELDLNTGTIRIANDDGKQSLALNFWIDAYAPIIRLDGTSNMPVEMTVTYDGWRRTDRELKDGEIPFGLKDAPWTVIARADTLIENENSLLWCHHNTYSIWKEVLTRQSLGDFAASNEDPLLKRTFGALAYGVGLQKVSPEVLKTEQPQQKIQLAVAVLTAKAESVNDWVDSIKQTVAQAATTSDELRKRAHDRYWGKVWEDHYILVDAETDRAQVAGVTKGYMLQRYVNLCSGKGECPIKFNGNIFNVDSIGPPYDADYRAWGGCYWWQNTRLPYFAMLYSGDFSLMKPLFGMYKDALPMGRFQTEKFYGFKGAYFPETMYFWGTMNMIDYGWTRTWTDNSLEAKTLPKDGKQPDRLSQNRYIRYLWEGGLELTSLMLDYYEFTGNKAFLIDTLLPLSKDIVTFYHNRYTNKDSNGKIIFEPAQAVETYWDITNPMTIIAGFNYILPKLIAMDEVPNEDKQLYSEMLTALPNLPMTEENGQLYLAAGENLHERTNFEAPELYAIFPFRLFGVGKAELEVAVRSYEKRIDTACFGWYQDGIFAANVGDGEEAARIVRENFNTKNKDSRFEAFWGPNYDWTPDQDHGNVNMRTLQNMIVQNVGDTILLFPAWKKEWNVHFKVHAPNNTTIEGTLHDNIITKLDVIPHIRRKNIVLPKEISMAKEF